MKDFFKKYGLSIIFLLVLVIIFTYYLINYRIEFNSYIERAHKIEEMVKNGIIEKPEWITYFMTPRINDAFSLYFEILSDKLSFIISIIPLFILFPSCIYFYKKLNSGMIRAEIMREDYKKFLKYHFKIAYKNMLIVAIFLVVSFLFCFIISGRFDIWNSYEDVKSLYIREPLEIQYIKNFVVFLPLYVTNLILLAGYYISVFLIVLKKKMPYIVSCISSFLIILGINIFLEIMVGFNLEIHFHIPYMNSTFNSYCFWVPGDRSNIYIQFIIALVLFITSRFLVYKVYKNKEQVLINYEL